MLGWAEEASQRGDLRVRAREQARGLRKQEWRAGRGAAMGAATPGMRFPTGGRGTTPYPEAMVFWWGLQFQFLRSAGTLQPRATGHRT